MQTLSTVEFVALMALLEKLTGLRCYAVAGGPSLTDPLAQIRVLLGFKGKNTAVCIRFSESGEVELSS